MMEIIIAILIIILIFGLIFINSVRDYRIKKLEEDVEEIYHETGLNIKQQNHADRSGLPSLQCGTVTVYPKPDNPHKSPIAPKTKEGNYVVVYKNGKEVARYKTDDES